MQVVDLARKRLPVYCSRTGLSTRRLARRIGYSQQTIHQFMANCYGENADQSGVARALMAYMDSNPAEEPASPGKLYETENVRILDEEIERVKRGAWSLIYGPPGTQKTFIFEYRQAEAWRTAQGADPALAYVYAQAGMAPSSLLREIGRSLWADTFTAGYRHAYMEAIFEALRGRRNSVAIIIDEAHHLGGQLETLEVLREVGDRGRVGLLLAGHDNLETIFQSKKSGPLEQWFSRIDYHRRLPGLTHDEVSEIARAELGPISQTLAEKIVKGAEVPDHRQGKTYLSMRRLMKIVAQAREKRGQGNGGGRGQDEHPDCRGR